MWGEIWHLIDPLFQQVLSTGEGTFRSDELLPMHRHGYTEECYFDYTFSPIRGESGAVEGVFNAVTETTYRVISARRGRVLRDLAAATARARSAEDACRLAAESLGAAAHDVPFSLLYLVSQARQANLLGVTGLARGGVIAPEVVKLTDDEAAAWPLAKVVRTERPEEVSDLKARFGTVSVGPWPEALTQAVVFPVAATGRGGVAAVLVAGVSPRRTLDDDYRTFFQLATDHVATAVANARAYEAERQRSEQLAELDRAKTAFFSNVSHEFRTPLTLMLGPLEDILGGGGEHLPQSRELLTTVHRNGQRLLKLVNSLLDFSRIEAGRVKAAFEPTDLARYTADLASVFRAAVEKAGMRLVVECPPLPEPAFVDRDMWERIVLNLVSNAFKYTLDGDIRVGLRAEGRHALLSVADTGVGIPEHELKNLFNRFHRIEGVRGRTLEGTGIGLALVQELVKLHGGEVTVSSVAGKGSTFTVRLPLGKGHLPGDQTSSTREPNAAALGAAPFVEEALRWLPDAGPEVAADGVGSGSDPGLGVQTVRGPRPKVVLADDNADMRDYVRRLLLPHYDVVAVRDGEEALRAVQAGGVELVLTDVMMPTVDGFGLLKALRAAPHTAGLPVIMLSARAGEEARIEGIEAGADDYLVKPFAARELLARVGGTLALARARREAQRREEALTSELASVLESMTDGFVTIDRDWRFTHVNAAAERLTGMTRGELLGKNQWELFPATLGTVNEVSYRRAMDERVAVEFENYYPPFDRWYGVNVYPVPDNGIAVYFREVTERKRAEEALRASAEQLRLALTGARAGVWELDLATGKTTWSAELFDVLGIDPSGGSLGLEEFANLIDPDDRHRVLSGFETAVAQGGSFEFEFRVNRPSDGKTCWVSSVGRVERNAEGRPGVARGINQDISARKETEQALEETRRFMERVAATSPAILLVYDLDLKRNVYANRDIGEVLGYAPGESEGASPAFLSRIMHPDDLARPQTPPFSELADGQIVTSEYRMRHADGTWRWRQAHLTVFSRRADGTPKQLLGVSQDVTDRKAAEEELRDADRKKDEFLALLAHELRNPLAPLRNGLQVLRLADRNPDAATKARGMMERQLGHMVRLIDDLLDVSRISRNKLTLRVERLRLSDVVASAVETARPAIEAAGHELSLQLPAAAAFVDGDLTRLSQVFSNLLTNSAKYTQPGGRIRLVAEVNDGVVVLSVSDNGIGIPAESLPRIFDMFSQVDRSIERSTGGLGIGLALVRGLVEMHGGTVAADSPGLGQGSTFTVRLPLAGRGSSAGEPTTTSEPAAAKFSRRVLVVDDNRDSAESMAMMLKLLGSEVQTAHDGVEAIEAAERFRPEVILMDVGMPRMNGFEATRRIRETSPGREMTIVALTGWGQDSDREKSREAGCDGHLVKPVALEDLEQLLKALHQSGARSDGGGPRAG